MDELTNEQRGKDEGRGGCLDCRTMEEIKERGEADGRVKGWAE